MLFSTEKPFHCNTPPELSPKMKLWSKLMNNFTFELILVNEYFIV